MNPFPQSMGLRFAEAVCAGHPDRLAALEQLVPDGASQMGLAAPWQAEGEQVLGPIDEVVNADSLARLYAHPLREIRDGDHRWFIPA